MIILDFITIGENLYKVRKKNGLTQAEVAKAADLSIRTYADIERGTVNMRVETILRICNVLKITPDEIMTKADSPKNTNWEILSEQLNQCSQKDRETAFKLLSVYLDSLK